MSRVRISGERKEKDDGVVVRAGMRRWKVLVV